MTAAELGYGMAMWAGLCVMAMGGILILVMTGFLLVELVGDLVRRWKEGS